MSIRPIHIQLPGQAHPEHIEVPSMEIGGSQNDSQIPPEPASRPKRRRNAHVRKASARTLARKWLLQFASYRGANWRRIMARATNILIVDDDADFREALRTVLEAEGCTVYEAADGQVALGILLHVVPHLILFDLEMPGMNGWDLHAELQRDAALAAIPIGVLSCSANKRPTGSMHVLNKPVDLPNLLGLLRAIEAPNKPSTAPRLGPAP
jgi:CheY-like chemotaxis protein